VTLCRETLLPLGIDFRSADGSGRLPFENSRFDMVIDRHGDFNVDEICRVLKPGGLFITQQVGAENDRELVQVLCGETPLPFPDQYLSIASRKFRDAGFRILREMEAGCAILTAKPCGERCLKMASSPSTASSPMRAICLLVVCSRRAVPMPRRNAARKFRPRRKCAAEK
jgi:SAM-dependent methyltransferase